MLGNARRYQAAIRRLAAFDVTMEDQIPPEPITLRFCEKTLRDAGVPKRLARAIVQRGFAAAVGDDATGEIAEISALVDRLETLAHDMKVLNDDRSTGC